MNTKDSILLHHVGAKLKTLRHEQGMSLEEVKKATGIAVAIIEAGEKDFKVDVLAALCDHYQVGLAAFFREIEKQLS